MRREKGKGKREEGSGKRTRGRMVLAFWQRFTFVALATMAIPSRALAQQSHSHSATPTTLLPAANDMAGMEMSSGDDWKMAALARHMAYSSARPLTAADWIPCAMAIS